MKNERARFCKFLTLYKDLADNIYQARGQQLQFDRMKLFIKPFLIPQENKFLGNNLQMLLLCWLIFSWLSIWIFISFTDEEISTMSYSIKKLLWFDCLITFLNNNRRSYQKVFCKESVLKNFAKVKEKSQYRSLFFNKFTGVRQAQGHSFAK